MHPIRRIRAYSRQIRKERSDVWMTRLKMARAGAWARLHLRMACGIFCERDLQRFERHSRRLSKLNLPATRWDHQLVATFFYMPLDLFPRKNMPAGDTPKKQPNPASLPH